MTSLRPFIAPGLRQVRRLWLPFVVIQLVGLGVVVTYFLAPGVRAAFAHLTDFKARVGIPFSMAALGFACGVVPEVFKFVTGTDRRLCRDRLTFMLHNVVVFGLLGLPQELFYRWLGTTFGDTRQPGIVVEKMLIDMLGYSPLLAVPYICFSFTLREHRYRLPAAARQLGVAWYLREAVPVLVVNLAYWVPMGLLMYTLPPAMTFVYGAIGSAASSTLLTAIASRDAAESRRDERPADAVPAAA